MHFKSIIYDEFLFEHIEQSRSERAKCVEILKYNMLFCFHFDSLLPSRIVTVESVLSVEFGVSAVELSKLQGYKMNSVLSSV